MGENNTTTANLFTEDVVLEMFKENEFTLIGMYVPVFVSAFVANIIVIIVVFKDQYMRSVTNYFLVNLSVADLLVTLVCMPNAAWRAYTGAYNFGLFTCKISAYLQCISVASSIFTITAMAIDRYLAISRPFGLSYRCFNKTTTVKVIIVIWLTSLILFSPTLWIYKLREESFPNEITVRMCEEQWTNFIIPRRIAGCVWFILMFAIPGIIMLFAYSMMGRTLCFVMPPMDSIESTCIQRNRLLKARKRVACILLLLAFGFACCWLPYHIMNLIRDLGSTEDCSSNEGSPTEGSPIEDSSMECSPDEPNIKRKTNLNLYLLLLGHANSALNPIIYCALSKKFRNSITNLFSMRITFRRKRPFPHWADSSASGFQLNRFKTTPPVHHPLQNLTLRSINSSQRTTKTCAV